MAKEDVARLVRFSDMTIDLREFDVTLRPGERLYVAVPIDGFFASAHSVPVSNCVGLSNQRYVVYAKRGMMKKRFEEIVSWPLSDFTPRLNSSEGSALGPFLYVLTLFTNSDETVSAGFRTAKQRDEFTEMVNRAFDNGVQ